jgi:hypothetical protein
MEKPTLSLAFSGVVPSICDAEAGDAEFVRDSTQSTGSDGSSGQPEPGAHVVTMRKAYVHHGIYLGDGLVAHYAGFVRGLRPGPIEAVSIERFTQGRPLYVIPESSPSFSSAEIVQRALSRVGEDRYHFLHNNCEHFCEWCLRAEHRSHQVDRLLSWPLRVLEHSLEVVAKLINLPGYCARVHDELVVGRDRSLMPALPPHTQSVPVSRE